MANTHITFSSKHVVLLGCLILAIILILYAITSGISEFAKYAIMDNDRLKNLYITVEEKRLLAQSDKIDFDRAWSPRVTIAFWASLCLAMIASGIGIAVFYWRKSARQYKWLEYEFLGNKVWVHMKDSKLMNSIIATIHEVKRLEASTKQDAVDLYMSSSKQLRVLLAQSLKGVSSKAVTDIIPLVENAVVIDETHIFPYKDYQQYAGPHEIVLGRQGFGVHDANFEACVTIPFRDGESQHFVILGATGSGKTTKVKLILFQLYKLLQAELWICDLHYDAAAPHEQSLIGSLGPFQHHCKYVWGRDDYLSGKMADGIDLLTDTYNQRIKHGDRTPLYFVLEESTQFLQKHPEKKEQLEEIITSGRKFNIGIIFLLQRIDKKLLPGFTGIQNCISMRADEDAAHHVLRHRKTSKHCPRLLRGQAYIDSPENRLTPYQTIFLDAEDIRHYCQEHQTDLAQTFPRLSPKELREKLITHQLMRESGVIPTSVKKQLSIQSGKQYAEDTWYRYLVQYINNDKTSLPDTMWTVLNNRFQTEPPGNQDTALLHHQ